MKALHKLIRVKKEDSAFVYFILEAQEGMTSYSTLKHETGSPTRDIELCFHETFEKDVNTLMKRLGEMVNVLK